MQDVRLKLRKQSYRTKEAYKSLRTNIEFCGSDIKVISITSCTPNEGKSSVAMGLAEAFGEAGKRTLLIDADLRKSVLVSRYRTGAVRLGLLHYLVGQNNIDDIMCKTDSSNLFIAFSGPVPPNPSELMGGERFSSFISSARKTFDVIIVDTPPLGSVIDAAVVATKCDGTVLVVENNAISYRFAQNVKDQLDRSGCRILGAVLNKVDMTAKGQYGHYGRYYGKYYGKYYGNYGSALQSENHKPEKVDDKKDEPPKEKPGKHKHEKTKKEIAPKTIDDEIEVIDMDNGNEE